MAFLLAPILFSISKMSYCKDSTSNSIFSIKISLDLMPRLIWFIWLLALLSSFFVSSKSFWVSLICSLIFWSSSAFWTIELFNSSDVAANAGNPGILNPKSQIPNNIKIPIIKNLNVFILFRQKFQRHFHPLFYFFGFWRQIFNRFRNFIFSVAEVFKGGFNIQIGFSQINGIFVFFVFNFVAQF